MSNMQVVKTAFAEKPAPQDGQPGIEEIASVVKDDLFRGFFGNRLDNPDQVLATESRGLGLAFYDALERDYQVASVLQKRKLAVIGREWEIRPASEAPRDQEIADFVRTVFESMGTAIRQDVATAGKSGFDAARMDLLDALLKGFSVGELLWRVGDDGAVVLDEIKGRNPRRFSFDPENGLRLLTLADAFFGEVLPPRKFVVLTFNKRYDNPYGRGLGQQLWWPVWFKKHGLKFWATFMEKFGMPTVVGKYPSGTTKEKQDALLDAMKALQQETAVKIPDGMVLELLEAQRQGSLNTYADFIHLMDSAISKVVLGETLTTEIGPTGGAYAASRTHNDVRLELVKADADLLCEVFNTQVIPPLVAFNFSGVQDYPSCWIRTDEDADLNKQSERDDRLVRMGLPVAKKYFYDTYSIPQPAAGEEVLTPSAPAPVGPPAAGAGPNAGGIYMAQDLVRQYREVQMLETLQRLERRQESA